ncbi:tRNA (Uracil-5-)-methyltransferase, putative, partial [Bodo saltans]
MLCMELDPTSLPAGLVFQEAVVPMIIASYTSADTLAALQAVQSTARVVSIQYYVHTGTASPQFDAQRTVIYGAPALTESLMGLSFDLSPAAFFQVNTPAFEDLLHRVHQVANLNKNTVLLDLCCGTGTIGLCLARHVKRVIGIELISSAVDNARINATRNNITNATFLAGRIENLLPDVINSLSTEDRTDVVAILDPPRAGVHNTVIKWIRSTESIRRAVYISCEQKALENDCPGFTKP